MDELNNLRREIDQIDRQLVELFCRRMDATRRVGQVKAAAGIPVLDQDREREVLMSRGNLAGEELRPAVITLYQTIMTLSRRQQQEGMAFNKLVRDKIPAMIEAAGEKTVTRILGEEEYLNALEQKLDEEVGEFHEERNLEELADILEVVYALAEAVGYSKEELLAACQAKNDRRGGFGDRIFLISKE